MTTPRDMSGDGGPTGPGSCSVRVYDGSFRGHMCQRKPKVVVSGDSYCAIHDPAAVAARREKSDARWKAESERWTKNFNLQSAAQEMLNLLIESQTSIGGDWRERRDAAIAKATGSKDQNEDAQ